MSTATTLKILSKNSDETESIAEQLSKHLELGQIIELRADLGGGKTTFIKGLARGLGYEGQVSSPTFTLQKQYQLKNDAVLYHFDFYRLSEPGLIQQVLSEVLENKNGIIAVEWAENLNQTLPQSKVTITLNPVKENPNYRSIFIRADKKLLSKIKDQKWQ